MLDNEQNTLLYNRYKRMSVPRRRITEAEPKLERQEAFLLEPSNAGDAATPSLDSGAVGPTPTGLHGDTSSDNGAVRPAKRVRDESDLVGGEDGYVMSTASKSESSDPIADNQEVAEHVCRPILEQFEQYMGSIVTTIPGYPDHRLRVTGVKWVLERTQKSNAKKKIYKQLVYGSTAVVKPEPESAPLIGSWFKAGSGGGMSSKK